MEKFQFVSDIAATSLVTPAFASLVIPEQIPLVTALLVSVEAKTKLPLRLKRNSCCFGQIFEFFWQLHRLPTLHRNSCLTPGQASNLPLSRTVPPVKGIPVSTCARGDGLLSVHTIQRSRMLLTQGGPQIEWFYDGGS